MTRFKIPERFQSGIRSISSLNNDEMPRLSASLGNQRVLLKPRQLAENAAKESGLPSSIARDIVDTLIALLSIQSFAEIRSIDEFATAICRSMEEDSAEVEIGYVQLHERLVELLRIRSIQVASKASGLQHEHQHVFCSARIFTDIRPIFGDDHIDSPDAVVLFHNLKLSYHEGSEIRDFFFALDGEDLTTLRELLDRAEQKVKSLTRFLESTKIARLD